MTGADAALFGDLPAGAQRLAVTPGRIDHHNVQIALTLLVVACIVWSDRKRWAAMFAGALSGAGPDGLSASECGEAVGIARSSARRYLEYLVDTGAAAVRHRYGSAGRPERRYQPADQ